MGKSTRAHAWCDALGAELISGDRPLLHVESLELYGVPWDGKEHCHKNVHFPLRAFLEIRRSRLNYLRKMSFEECRKFLMRQCFLPMWDTDTAAVQMQNILYLAKKAPVVRAFCGPAGEDAKEIRENLLKNIVEEYDVDKATEEMDIIDFEQRKSQNYPGCTKRTAVCQILAHRRKSIP